MLKKTNRLSSKRDFKIVYQKGRFAKGKLLFVNYLPNNLGVSRLGFVISRKTAPKATVRNLAKRRLRAAAKVYIAKIKPGNDIIINIKAIPKDKPFESYKTDLEQCLKKSALL